MRIRSSGGQGDEVGLDEPPMLDCVFVLNVLNKVLIIFCILVTALINAEKELELKLPESRSGVREQIETRAVIINVLADGRMKVGENYFDLDGLVEHLKQVALANQETPVTIRGDRSTHLQNAVRAMDACGRANLKRVSVGILDDGVTGRDR